MFKAYKFCADSLRCRAGILPNGLRVEELYYSGTSLEECVYPLFFQPFQGFSRCDAICASHTRYCSDNCKGN